MYLLARDMTAISALIAVFFSFGVVAASANSRTAALYSAALVAQYVLIASAARNYGTRFVLNVLAEVSHS
ncbi:MAG: hypothetical protein DMG32_02185 [Acidobacteria bacterium]|nr:MAG: hypothetical protein DMG32_02185 [Acidobacteriota bacterium]